MAFLVTTTGTLTTVVFNDLGGRTLTHPVAALDLELEFSSSELASSADVQAAITGGTITVTDANGEPITDAAGVTTLPTVTTAEATTGTSTARRVYTPLRVAEAIAALTPGVTPPDATESVKGVAEIATKPETIAGTDDSRIVTPLKMRQEFQARVIQAAELRIKRAKLLRDWAVDQPANNNDDGVSGAPNAMFSFDDTIEEGVGTEAAFRIPTGALTLELFLVLAASVIPGAVSNAGLRLYTKTFAADAVRQASGFGWVGPYTMPDAEFPTNNTWQYHNVSVPLLTLGLTGGNMVRIEVTRTAPQVGPNLPGDMDMREEGLLVGFS